MHRVGKPRKNRKSDGTVIRSTSPAGSYGLHSTGPTVISRTDTHTAESSPEPADPFYFCPATPEYYQDAYMASSFNDGQSPAYSDGSMLNGWPSEEQVLFGAPTDVFTPMPQFLTPQPPYGGHVRSDSVQSQPEMFTPNEILRSPPIGPDQPLGMQHPVLAHQDKTITSPAPVACVPLPTPPPPPANVSVPRHDCTSYAFQTLRSLYTPSISGSLTVDFASFPDELPTWTDTLSITKSAVESIHNLLDCSCSVNPHFSSTTSLVISKVLSSYESMAGVDERNRIHSRSAQVGNSAQTSNPKITTKVSSDHEMSLRTNIVLSELRRVEKLVDKFSERYSKHDNSLEFGIESGIYQAMEAELRTRVRDTFKVIMRTAPEEVKRQVAYHSQNRVRVHTM
ncbi:hypothetical protein NX059_006923 [Plenodomus lindquistii]|nr:hypothetical protein NX059_006923 [Plenodomus lindquistii]